MKRSTLYSVIVLIALAIVAFFALRREGELSTSGTTGQMLVSYDSSAVDKIELFSPAKTIVLEKKAGTWMLTSPINYRADQTSAASAVGKGRRIELKSLVSTNPENQKLFQVDSTGTLVKVYANGTLKASFVVGKPSNSYTENYIRLSGSNDVQLTNEVISSYFTKQVKDWRDRTVFKTDESGIKNVTFQYGDTTFTLMMQDSLWRIGTDSANQTTVKPLLTALARIEADDFIDSTFVPPPKPTAMIEVEGTQIRFYKNDATKYFVQTSQSPQWFEVQNWRTTNLLKRRKDLLPTVK